MSCASCLDFSVNKIVKSNSELKPSWLEKRDFVEDFINAHGFICKTPAKYDTSLTLNLGKKAAGRKILYWAALPKTNASPLIAGAKTAYHKFENNGVVKANSEGKATIQFMCPQVYSTVPQGSNKPQTFFKHVHFVIANASETQWLSQIYTRVILCEVDYKCAKSMLHSGLNVFINALPCAYYGKDHIPNSYNLPVNDVKKMSVDELRVWFSEVVKLHYPKLYTYLKSRKIQIYEIPIVVYCAHSECNASILCAEELMKKGFVNIVDFTGGMKTYRQHN